MHASNLIFIVSQPRSGSTLLQKIVSNSPRINTVSEHWLLLPFLSVLRTDLQNSIFDSKLAAEVIEEFLNKFNMQKTFVEEQRKFLLKLYEPLMNDKVEYVLDKTPRYYEILNELVAYFPEAKIIILIRNPLDVLQSIIHTWNMKSLRGLHYYHRDILLAPILLNKFCSEQKNNSNVIMSYYEDIVENVQKEISTLFNWLNIPFDQSILDFTKNQKASGKRGDPTGIKLYNKIVSKEEKTLNNKAYEQVWKSFAVGYKHYLKGLAMENYSRYNFEDGRTTSVFNYYLKTNTPKPDKRQLTVRDFLLFIKTKLFIKQRPLKQ